MARRRRKKKKKTRPDRVPTGKYETAVRRGKELLGRYRAGGRRKSQRRVRIYAHYSREPIQRAMYEYAKGRAISALRIFRPLFSALKRPEDVLPLAFFFARRGKLWPSLHGTTKRKVEDRTLHDLVLEVDFKPNWRVAFEGARPLVRFLRDFGVIFKVKFSGNSSPHIIIPAEAFPPELGRGSHEAILDYANKHVKGRGHLDMSFRNADHFLRLAYSLNERAGRVSVPIDPDRYEDFNPRQAEVGSAKVLRDWWAVPSDAPERTREMIRFILEKRTISAPRRRKGKGLKKAAAKQFEKMPPEALIIPGDRRRAGALRRLQMPYDQMLKNGRRALQRREELRGDARILKALEVLQDIHGTKGVVSVQETSATCGVNERNLWFAWRWLLHGDVFDYYARDDVQDAMFLHSLDRKVRLGSGREVVDLADPGDILTLAAYIHETQGRIDHPTFYCTNAQYDATTKGVLGCDIAVRIDGKGDGALADRMARSAVALLRQAGAGFALSVEADALSADPRAETPRTTVRHIVVPSEAVPGVPKTEEDFGGTVELMAGHFRKALPHADGVSVLAMGEYIPLFYSVDEISGAANVPVRVGDIDAAPPARELGDVRVRQD